jgi:hypothetical protein
MAGGKPLGGANCGTMTGVGTLRKGTASRHRRAILVKANMIANIAEMDAQGRVSKSGQLE